jgi:hypothetical protein
MNENEKPREQYKIILIFLKYPAFFYYAICISVQNLVTLSNIYYPQTVQ